MCHIQRYRLGGGGSCVYSRTRGISSVLTALSFASVYQLASTKQSYKYYNPKHVDVFDSLPASRVESSRFRAESPFSCARFRSGPNREHLSRTLSDRTRVRFLWSRLTKEAHRVGERTRIQFRSSTKCPREWARPQPYIFCIFSQRKIVVEWTKLDQS